MASLISPQILHFHNVCPFCMRPFDYTLKTELNEGELSEFSIHPHCHCPEFTIYVDPKGKIRGTLTSFY